MIQKLLILILVVLLCGNLTSAWFGGGNRGGSGSRGGSSSHNSGSNSGRKSGTSVDVGVEADKDGARVSGSVNHQGDGWSASFGGSVNDKGEVEAGGSVSIKFRKRSISWNDHHYTVTIHAVQCYFDLYDLNGDGVITKDEVQKLFGKGKEANDFFNDLDLTSGDGKVDRLEFNYMAPIVINGCKEGQSENPL